MFLLPSAAAFYTDWLWFKEVGFEAIFARRIRTSFLTGGVAFAVAFAVLWTNALVALSVLTQPYVVIASTAQGQPILFNRAQVRRAATIIATVAALAMALPASTRWLDLLEYRHAVRSDRPIRFSTATSRSTCFSPRAATSCAGSRSRRDPVARHCRGDLHPRRRGRDRAA